MRRVSHKQELSSRGLSQSALAAKCQLTGWDIGRDTIAKIEGQMRWVGELADLNPRTVQKIEADDITILVTTLDWLRTAIGCDWRRLLGT